MGRSEWPDHLIEKLIVMYRERPSLWKLNHVDYMNKKAKTQDYLQIVNEMKKSVPNVDVTLIKQKIQNMRTSFRKERRKVLVSEQKGGEIHEPHLWYYKLLSFVKDQDVPTASTSYNHGVSGTSLDEDSVSNDSGDPNVRSKRSTSQLNYMEKNDESGSEESIDKSWNEVHPDVEIHPYFRDQPPAAKRSRMGVDKTELLKTLTAVLTAQPENDECDTTGKYVAQKLKQMNPSQQMLAESIIQIVLSKGLRNQLTENTQILELAHKQ